MGGVHNSSLPELDFCHPSPFYAEVRFCFFLAWHTNAWLDQTFKVWKTVPHGLCKQVVLLLSWRTVCNVGLAGYSCVPREARNLFFFLCNLVDQLAYILVSRKSSQNEMTTPFIVQEEDNMLGSQLLRPEVEGDQNREGFQFTNCVLLSLRHQKAADGTAPLHHQTSLSRSRKHQTALRPLRLFHLHCWS